jgi:hypothetical protein
MRRYAEAISLYIHFGGHMADVQISNTPGSTDSGSSSWVWAIVVLVLLALVAWFVFGGGMGGGDETNIDINAPGANPPASGAPATPPPAGTPATPPPPTS